MIFKHGFNIYFAFLLWFLLNILFLGLFGNFETLG